MPDWRMPLKTGLNFLLLDLYVGFFSSWPIKIEIMENFNSCHVAKCGALYNIPPPPKKKLNRSCNQNG